MEVVVINQLSLQDAITNTVYLFCILIDDKDDEPPVSISKTKSDAASKPQNALTKPSKPSPSAVTTATTVTPVPAKATAAPTTPLGVNLAKVDLGKISSILSSLTSAMKNTGGFRRGHRWFYDEK